MWLFGIFVLHYTGYQSVKYLVNVNTNTDNGQQKDHMYAERGPNGHVVEKNPAIHVYQMHSE